jgi:hypothetical protein
MSLRQMTDDGAVVAQHRGFQPQHSPPAARPSQHAAAVFNHEAACMNATGRTSALSILDDDLVARIRTTNNRAATACFETTNRRHNIRMNGHNFL